MRKKRAWKCKVLSLFLAVVLIFGTVGTVFAKEAGTENLQTATGLGATVTLQIEGYGYTVSKGTKVTMPSTYKSYAEYGLTGVKEPETPGFTILHVLAEYCMQQDLVPAEMIEVSGGYINSFFGLPEKYLMFIRNHYGIQAGADQQKIEDGDQICAADIWIDSNSWEFGASYTWFSEEMKVVKAEDAFTLQLHASDIMSGSDSSAEGAEVQVWDTSETRKVATATTDASGKATLVVNEPGTYQITAERRSTLYDTDGSHPYDITRPHCALTVEAPEPVTDEQAVEIAKEALSLGDLSAVTEKLTLPSAGMRQTQISWASSDPSVVTNEGTVTRVVGEDKTATLTATITKGAAKTTKEFVVTVKGYSLLLKHLSVQAEGKELLEFAPEKEAYTVYVGENTEEVLVSAEIGEGDWPKVWLFINEEWQNLNYGEATVEFSLEETTMQIPVKVGTINGEKERTVTITVKRAADIGEPLPELPDNTWGQHLGNKDNNAVTEAPAPTENGNLLWESFSNGQESWGSVYAGTPILVNQTIYAVRNEKLQALDAKTGELKQSADLLAGISFYSNITYGGGMIFVPLADGRIQCFHAAELKSMFVTEKPGDPLFPYQIYGSIHYDNGVIYVGYTDMDQKGYFAAYDTIDLDQGNEEEIVLAKWSYGEGSYYGTGAVTVGNAVIFAGDDGVISSVDIDSGRELGNCKTEGSIRGALVYADGYVWAATQGKKLYKVAVDEKGSLSVAAQTDIPLITNASPVVTGGKVYLTGGDFSNGGFLAVYDSNLTLLAKTKLTAAANTPTVTTAYDDVYVYFTQNDEDGALYVAKVTASNKITVTKLYQPEHKQYSMSKVIVGSDGTIYYGNDSGYLFAVQAGEKTPEPTPDPGTDEKPQEENTTAVADLKPVKTSVSKEKITKKTASENIALAIEKSAEDGETSLTIKNVPEILEAPVFRMLEKYPQFRMVLDMGSYTISMKGADVKNTEAALCPQIVEKEKEFTEEEQKKLGNYQVFELKNKGELPGILTVVYSIPEKLKESEMIYWLDGDDLEHPEETVVQEQYVLFTLKEAGEFVLADRNAQAEEIAAKKAGREISAEMLPTEQKQARGIPDWLKILVSAAATAIVTAVIMTCFHNRRKKGEWDQ